MNESIMSISSEKEQQTKTEIADAILKLLNQNSYPDITVGQIAAEAHIGRRTFYRYFKTKDDVIMHISTELMDRFADTILKNQATDLKGIAKSYFEFWEAHIEVLLVLKKSHLLYFIEDNLPDLIQQVALKVKHISKEAMANVPPEQMEKYLYAYYFRLAGFWKVTLHWCEQTPRKTPEKMSELMYEIAFNKMN